MECNCIACLLGFGRFNAVDDAREEGLKKGYEDGYSQAIKDTECSTQTTPVDECCQSEECCMAEPDFPQVVKEYSIREANGGFIVEDPDEVEHVFSDFWDASAFLAEGYGAMI